MKALNLAFQEKSDIAYKRSEFPDGQQQITLYPSSLQESFKSTPVVIQSRLRNFVDLELIICAKKALDELDVKEVHLYTPYFLGSRSDRKFEQGSNNYLKDVICPIINSLNFKTVTCIDPHSYVLEACIKGFRKESNEKIVRYALQQIIDNGKNSGSKIEDHCVLVSPDAGASKKIYKLAEQIGYKGDIITCSKDRDIDGKLTKTIVPINASMLNKDFIIIDDICDGGATFINIAKEIKNSQFKTSKIYLIVTHSIFSKGTDELLKYFDGIFTTNSYKEHNVEKVKVLNIF